MKNYVSDITKTANEADFISEVIPWMADADHNPEISYHSSTGEMFGTSKQFCSANRIIWLSGRNIVTYENKDIVDTVEDMTENER